MTFPHEQPGVSVVYVVPPPPRMYDFAALQELTSMGRDALYEVIHSGALKTRQVGRKFYALEDEVRAWQATLPEVVPAEVLEERRRMGRRRRRKTA